MAILPIRTVGDPVLRTEASTVTRFGTELERLVADMAETMANVNGAGLAAPQVGVSLRIFTFDVDGVSGHVINPELELGEEKQADHIEGCLSVPELGFVVPRKAWARVTGLDVTGGPVEYEGTGILARCFHHETDHLNGRLYIDRLAGEDRKVAFRAMRQADYDSVVARTKAEREQSIDSIFGRSSPGNGAFATNTGIRG
ncbi:peptide deformylase [Arthrobacter roseus]|uniref:peptide deformylase n=1 Tax=Arthrobacter roseus TaxID=136274 RepID=UPI0019625B8D|nr:peptide deformylase [Arthrobacter roseus]MBM7848411.1 peptide deformylase [Arthrobacter roseus]